MPIKIIKDTISRRELKDIAENQFGDFIEFNSMINIRPSQNNRSRSVESLDIQRKIRDIISKLVL